MKTRAPRWLTVLVALGMVVAAALGLRLSERGATFEEVTGAVGSPVRVRDGSVSVSRVRVGQTLERSGSTETTSGMFLVVTVVGSATGRDPLSFGHVNLVDGDTTYDEFYDLTLQADPGFESTIELAFEVDPVRIDADVALELRPSETIKGYQEHLHLELVGADQPGEAPAGDPRSWSTAARDHQVTLTRMSKRALP